MVETKTAKTIKKTTRKASIKKVAVAKKAEAQAQKIKKEVRVESKKNSTLDIPFYNLEGSEEKSVELPKEIFAVDVSPRLLAQYIRVYLTNQRQGTASTKTRGDVVGSTRKIYKQKGTGRARHGSIKAPIFVGGGVVAGPKPKEYTLKINKKQKRKALFGALTSQAKKNAVLGLVDNFLSIEPKTKNIVKVIKKLSLEKEKILCIVPKMEKNGFILSVRNIPNIDVLAAENINPYVVLRHQKIAFTESSLEVLKRHFIR